MGPHFVLLSRSEDRPLAGRWRFEIRSEEGQTRLAAEDVEPCCHRDRLELLSIVRGLESLDEPSDVTLHTTSTYVHNGLTYGLDEWRSQGWTWEKFGRQVPINNLDLWQRLDRALCFHKVTSLKIRVDLAEGADLDESRPLDPAGRRLPRNSKRFTRLDTQPLGGRDAEVPQEVTQSDSGAPPAPKPAHRPVRRARRFLRWRYRAARQWDELTESLRMCLGAWCVNLVQSPWLD
jgi:ribonuclease HI